MMSHVFWKISYKSSHVLVRFGLCRGDCVRLAGERGGLTRELLLLGNEGEGLGFQISDFGRDLLEFSPFRPLLKIVAFDLEFSPI